MDPVPLWIAEPTGRCRLVLRRFCWGSSGHRHDARAVIGEDEPAGPARPGVAKPVTSGRIPLDDPRWPGHCPCGEMFRDTDEWQVCELDWYEGSGGRFALGIGSWDGLPGAMVRAAWRDTEGRPPAWLVFLPNGAGWNTNDRPAGAGGYWDVSGEAPMLTVSPSINDADPARPWHGWIRSGRLERAA